MTRVTLIVALLAACGDSAPGGAGPDARAIPDSLHGEPVAMPYRHTITIDGTDDFTAAEQFATTSATFTASITWDDVNLYIGYAGPDLATTVSDASTKWLFAYLDTSPGGQAQSEMYTSQRVTFPTGFAAEYYVRYKVDGTLTSLQQFDGSNWITSSPSPTVAQTGTFVELALPLTSIAAGTELGIVTWMINEKMFAEGTYAGLYMDNFTDGYAANLVLTAYLAIDFTAERDPNDAAARRP